MTTVFRLSFWLFVIGLFAGAPINGAKAADALEAGVKAYSAADYAGAVKLLTPIAQKGDTDAAYTLGLAHSKLTSKDDQMQAVMWLSIVAKTGDTEAAADRDRIGAEMKPEDFEAAKKQAEDWKPTK
jgi:TPR repeat protein